MPDIVPEIRVTAFTEAFCQGAATVFSQALGASWSVQPCDGQPVDDGVDACFRFQLSCSGGLSGSATIALRKQDALVLAQKSLAEEVNPAANITSDHEQSVVELFRQISGTVQAALSAQFGEVKLQLAPTDVQSSDGTVQRLIAAEGANKIDLQLRISPDLADALSTTKQPEDSGHEGPNEARDNVNLALLLGIDLNLTLRFGRGNLTLDELLAISPGAVIELDRQIQEPVDLLLGDQIIATGDVVVVDDNYGLRIDTVNI